MTPFQAIIFMIFFLPLLMIKAALAMISEATEDLDWNKWLWRTPNILLGILIFTFIVLWLEGYH